MFKPRKGWLSARSITTALVAAGLLLFSAAALADHKEGHNPGGGGGGGGGEPDSPMLLVVDLGGPLGWASAVNDVFNGHAEVAGETDGHATYWRVDALGNVETVSLPEPVGGFGSTATDINNLGEAVGHSDGMGTLWRFTAGAWSVLELPPLPGDSYSYAEAISDTGLIVGRSQGLGAGQSAVVWQVDETNEVHVFALAEPNVNNLVVNNLGQVAARVDGLGAVIWNLEFDDDGIVVGASEPMVLPNPLGGGEANVGSIKDFGQVSGSAYLNAQESHAVVWNFDIDAQGNVLITGFADLGTLPADDLATAADLNSAGQVVGGSGKYIDPKPSPRKDRPNRVAFLWQNGQMVDLNSLPLDNGGFKVLEMARGVNGSGWICGGGEKNRERHAYVAIPLP